MKPYQQIPIDECGEPLVPIPATVFAFEQPHPYEKLGAPYGGKSPYFVRQSVGDRLLQAQAILQVQEPGWRIQIFDAYRPIAVQQFMVEYAFEEVLHQRHLERERLSVDQEQAIWREVYQFWAMPSDNPATPPPHSTGAAVDITLVDATGQVVDMGSPIDEVSERSYPDHFARFVNPALADHCPSKAKAHFHRTLLASSMIQAGFCQHPQEWWHFSFGDQMWVWSTQGTSAHGQSGEMMARYGRV
jgi:D-alanyl-D-alanine dipeptidase